MTAPKAQDPSLQWAVDRLEAEFPGMVLLFNPGADDGQIISVKLPDGASFSRFLQVPNGVRCDPGYERMTETRLSTLIDKVYRYIETGIMPPLGMPEP